MSNNKRAIRYNKALGFCLAENQKGITKQLYVLEKEQYINRRENLLRLLR